MSQTEVRVLTEDDVQLRKTLESLLLGFAGVEFAGVHIPLDRTRLLVTIGTRNPSIISPQVPLMLRQMKGELLEHWTRGELTPDIQIVRGTPKTQL